MNFERQESYSESLPRLPIIANMLQISLIPLAYRTNHPEAEINMADKTLRNQMAAEWAHYYAGSFRDYIEDNPRETIDLSDEEALREFLSRITPEATMH
ncbi:MAG TPA: hypothetical protein VGE31_03520 [Candidatus Paceibacterota bacterium]